MNGLREWLAVPLWVSDRLHVIAAGLLLWLAVCIVFGCLWARAAEIRRARTASSSASRTIVVRIQFDQLRDEVAARIAASEAESLDEEWRRLSTGGGGGGAA